MYIFKIYSPKYAAFISEKQNKIERKILLTMMRALAALNMGRNLLHLARCEVCSASEWAHRNITVSILLLYLSNEMLKTVSFISELSIA